MITKIFSSARKKSEEDFQQRLHDEPPKEGAVFCQLMGSCVCNRGVFRVPHNKESAAIFLVCAGKKSFNNISERKDKHTNESFTIRKVEIFCSPMTPAEQAPQSLTTIQSSQHR